MRAALETDVLWRLAWLLCSYVYSVKNRIPFASATLKTACEAVRAHQQVVYVAFGAMVLQVLWIVFWSMAFFGVEANSTDDGYICEFFMLISFFWGLLVRVEGPCALYLRSVWFLAVVWWFVLRRRLTRGRCYSCACGCVLVQVIKNIVHCTASGTVGSWWFVANPESPVMGALKRACTTSLGSICLGSLIVAVLKALRAMIDAARRGARRNGNTGGAGRCAACCVPHTAASPSVSPPALTAHRHAPLRVSLSLQFLLACASCLVGCVERAMQFFNHWAFVQVALYGKDFRSAGRDAIRVFEVRRPSPRFNDVRVYAVWAGVCV